MHRLPVPPDHGALRLQRVQKRQHRLIRLVEAITDWAVFEFQHAARAHRRADAAADTRSAHDVLTALCVGAHVDSHFAVRGAVAAGHALATVGRDSESGEEPLHNAEQGSLRAKEATPDAASEHRIEPGTHQAGHHRDHHESVNLCGTH